jgi:hypothetical protein
MAFIERTDLRGRNLKHYQDDVDPTKHRLVTAIHDLHYHDGTTWQDTDENFIAETGTFAHQCVKVRHAIHIGATGTRRWMPRRDHPTEYIEFGRLQSWSGTSWSNVNLGTATRSANKISWSTTAFDLTLTNNWHRIKIDAVLKTEAARRRLRWAVTLSGLTYDQGNLTAVSDGLIVGRVDRPVAWDANGSIENQNVAITTSYGGGFIEFGGDLSAAVLPITIDPTLTLQPDATDGIDTFVTTEAATTNYGTNNQLIFNNNGSDTSLLKFVLTALSGTTINSATLSFWISDVMGYGAVTLTARRILAANSGWTETGATWNYAVASTTRWAGDTGNDGGADAGCSVSDTDVSSTSMGTIDLTNTNAGTANQQITITLSASEVSSMVGANHGISVRATTGSFFDYLSLHSSDGSTAGYRPQLVVGYTEAATGLVVAEGTQSQTQDAATVSFTGSIATAEGTQAQAQDAVTVTAITSILTAEGAQSQAGDASTVTAISLVTTSEGTQSQTQDAVTVSVTGALVVAEGTQSQTGDAASVISISLIATAEGTQSQSQDAVTVSFIEAGAATTITVAEGFQAQTGDSPTLITNNTITVGEGNQAQSQDAVIVTEYAPVWTITTAEGFQAQTMDFPGLGVVYVLATAEGNQTQTMDIAQVSSSAEGYRVEARPGTRANIITGTRSNISVNARENIKVR